MVASSLIYEYVGNLHMHTVYSDGEGTHADIAKAAIASSLDFVIVTDHNALVKGIEGYYGDDEQGHVLLLTGEEIHDQMVVPGGNHLLAYGHSHELAQCANNPQMLIDSVHAAGGSSFIAHPHDPVLDIGLYHDHGYT